MSRKLKLNVFRSDPLRTTQPAANQSAQDGPRCNHANVEATQDAGVETTGATRTVLRRELVRPKTGEGAFLPLINYRTPEEAAKARRMPMPPNLETYAAALTRDEIDDETVVEWSPFRIPDIDKGLDRRYDRRPQDSKAHGKRTPSLPLARFVLPLLHAGPRPIPQVSPNYDFYFLTSGGI
jgi:hypothetical protein